MRPMNRGKVKVEQQRVINGGVFSLEAPCA